MDYEVEEVLSKEDAITDAKYLDVECRFYLGELPTPVTIKIYKQAGKEQYYFYQSHWIKTPSQIGPYITSRVWESSRDAALSRAIDSLVSYYESAVDKGDPPDEAWLVKNEDFL